MPDANRRSAPEASFGEPFHPSRNRIGMPRAFVSICQAASSAPAQGGSDVGQNRLDDMRVVGDAQLVGDGQQQRVGLGDGLVLLELLDQDIRLGGIAAAEDRPGLLVDEADLVLILAARARNRRGRDRRSARRCCG